MEVMEVTVIHTIHTATVVIYNKKEIIISIHLTNTFML